MCTVQQQRQDPDFLRPMGLLTEVGTTRGRDSGQTQVASSSWEQPVEQNSVLVRQHGPVFLTMSTWCPLAQEVTVPY